MAITKSLLKDLSQEISSTGGTSLITYIVKPFYSLHLIGEKLNSELSTASNIKDKNVRKDVITALKSCLDAIKNMKIASTPQNGLVILSGETRYCS